MSKKTHYEQPQAKKTPAAMLPLKQRQVYVVTAELCLM